MKIGSFIVFLAISFLVACSSGGKDTPDPLGINGLWTASCYYDEEFDDYNIETYRFNGFSITASLEVYSNSSCTGEPDIAVSGSGTFTLGNTVITSGGPEAIEFDVILKVEDKTIQVSDLIRVDGDSLYWGVYIDGDTRPTEIDFDETYIRQ
jgi:hypothetical protein